VHVDADRDRVADRLLRDWPPQPGDPFGAGRAIEAPRPKIISRVPDSMLRRAARSAEVERQLRELGMGSLLFLPLVSSDLLLGSMTFVSPNPDAFTPEDLLLGEDLARIAALALDNARLRRSAADSMRIAEAARAENRELNRRLVEVNEQLLVSAVREHEEATTAKHREEETQTLLRMEEELHHSQRVESVGRLAGAIAHDFNNILMALGGRSEVMMTDLEENHPLREDIEEIQKNVDRAARLTSRLLAFSRRQMLQPETLRPDGLLEEMKQVLENSLGSQAATDDSSEPVQRRAPVESGGGTTTTAPRESRADVDAVAGPPPGTADEPRAVDRGDEAETTGPGSEEEASPSVLVVDDEDSIRALLTRILEESGFRVLTARGSREALEIFEAGGVPVDLVVTDVIMPDMSGAELARQLRTRNPELRALFISGHHETILDPDELREGSEFLAKPFTTDALVRAVQELLR
jgi:CheY-like chemotaxis protein